jgi:hypothetical protein
LNWVEFDRTSNEIFKLKRGGHFWT